jgi:lipopolysaccharide/colanic/teichoic acid biosynthesis glycosyltransferase
MYRYFLKHIIDFIIAFVALCLSLPILIPITIILVIENKGRPFFIQDRPGKNGAIFRILKFKTMTDKKDKNGNLLPDGERLTKTGKFIRKTSLDEIPQLINVIKGDMSIIGPRPLLPEYLSLYDDIQKKRHLVKPGITGWAQVNGRNAISWTKKFEYDVWYVQNITFLLDLKIIIKTVVKVFKSEGINTENQATTIKFTGNN